MSYPPELHFLLSRRPSTFSQPHPEEKMSLNRQTIMPTCDVHAVLVRKSVLLLVSYWDLEVKCATHTALAFTVLKGADSFYYKHLHLSTFFWYDRLTQGRLEYQSVDFLKNSANEGWEPNDKASSFLPCPFEAHATQPPKILSSIWASVVLCGNLLVNVPGRTSFSSLISLLH